jgi:NADH-quinone oxidoreductase subunit N
MNIDYRPLYSYFLLTGLGLFVAVAGAIARRRGTSWLGWLTALGAGVAIAFEWFSPETAPWDGLVRFDVLTKAFDTLFLAGLAVVALATAGREQGMRYAGEHYALLIFSAIGLMLMAASGGLLALYLGLELSTISLFALVGLRKRDSRSAEAALKFFILGAVASAVTLYGASIVYGVAGTTQFEPMAQWLRGQGTAFPSAFWLAMAFTVGGLAFKIAAAPFHLWAPDVYQGSPTLVTAFLSTASKAGAFAALLRLLLAGAMPAHERWSALIVVLAAMSMVVGNLVALAQSDLKRLLAYSGVAQAGYVLVAVAVGSDMGVSSALVYLFIYLFANIAAFLVAEAIEQATGSTEISALRGLHRRTPGLAFAMLVALLSLGGIPPFAGFVGKVYLFAAGWQGGQKGLVILGAVTSVVALYYYLIVALQVYIKDPVDDRRVGVSQPLGLAIALCVAATLALGIFPRPLVDLGSRAAASIAAPIDPTAIARR